LTFGLLAHGRRFGQDACMAMRSASGGPRQVGSYLARITRPALGKRGLAEAEVVLRWREIVGDALARQCLPERVKLTRGSPGGTLHLCVEPAAATRVQHLEATILERVNTFYGYRAVVRLQLRQQPLARSGPRTRPPPRALAPAERAAIAQATAGMADPDLRRALVGLGESVLARKSS
jgi:hypothetical protein